jgi:hypothetical protein
MISLSKLSYRSRSWSKKIAIRDEEDDDGGTLCEQLS